MANISISNELRVMLSEEGRDLCLLVVWFNYTDAMEFMNCVIASSLIRVSSMDSETPINFDFG
mgnify:FL=1